MSDRTHQYPANLAKLVAARLQAESSEAPAEAVLTQLLETLYFASLKTDEGRPILCTVNYLDPHQPRIARHAADCWRAVPFDRPLPFSARALAKLARAADPAVSSLAVHRDRQNKLVIWGLVDQEPRHAEFITLAALPSPDRPGLFQATITGVGNISVYQNETLIGSLEQNTLVEEYHDVLWSGPVHDLLVEQIRSYLAQSPACPAGIDSAELENELLMRWINAICRILMSIQQYRHGGGLLITPDASLDGLNITYKICYDRLLSSLRAMVESQLSVPLSELRRSLSTSDMPHVIPYTSVRDAAELLRLIGEHRNEVQGAVRFIASLSNVDGLVVADRRMAIHGFGVEVRSDNLLNEIYLARDSHADLRLLRNSELTQYGTRHRAMMRYCFDKPGALGFVVSQDGDIRAMTRIGQRLVLWENIDVQLAYKSAVDETGAERVGPVLRRVNTRVA